MVVLDESKLQKLRDANKKGVIIGLYDFTDGTAVPRLDIDTLLVKHPLTFNLLIIALDELQKDKSITGYAQIACIHGLPTNSWDGMGEKKNTKADQLGQFGTAGYCSHSEERFPTWHRSFVAMLEQTLFLRIVDLAKAYSDKFREQYIEAALQFRLPFWDYFRPRGGPVEFPGVIDKGTTTFDYDYSVPRIFTEVDVKVRRPPGNELESLTRNPFNYFDLKSADIIKDEDWNHYPQGVAEFPRDRTVRYRALGDGGNVDDTAVANFVVNELRMDSNRLVIQMLSIPAYNEYKVFAMNKKSILDKPVGEVKEAEKKVVRANGSLEALHNMYHLVLGGFPDILSKKWAGHMTQVPVAAFDPIFWFHHCQIDRLFALWQATHNSNKASDWFRDPKLAQKQLRPFRVANDHNDLELCWDSNQSRLCETFGYSYPEIADGGDVLQTIKDMYEWSVNLTDAGDIGEIPPEMEPVDVTASEIWLEGAKGNLLSTTHPGRKKGPKVEYFSQVSMKNLALPPHESEFSREWYIDDEVERLALNGSFTIFYFINDINRSLTPETNIATEPTLAGLTHIFTAPVELCDNCGEQAMQGNIVTNTVPITSMLLDYVKTGHLESLHPDHVGPFLIRALRWRIITVDAVKKDPRKLARENEFKVDISCMRARLPRNSGDVEYERYPQWIDAIRANASDTQTT